MARPNNERTAGLGWLVLLASIGAFAFCIATKGLSLVVLPLITMIVAGRATRRGIVWSFGAFYCAAYLAFGVFGLIAFLVVVVATFLLIFALNRALAIVFLLATLAFFLLLPAVSGARQKNRSMWDLSNVRQIGLGLQLYNSDSSVYPDRLSQLSKVVGSTQVFASPRGAGKKDWLAIGPLRMWLRHYDPGPVRVIRQWSEVDEGDYLYRKPSPTAMSNTIVIMTRPGLLYMNGVNIGYLASRAVFAREQEWKSRQDVFEFLRDLNLTNLLSVTTGD